MRIAAIADLHSRTTNQEPVSSILDGVEDQADVLVLCGDLTDNGLKEEAEVLCEQLHNFQIPIIAVLGNHDHEGGQADDISRVLAEAKVCLLNATAYEINGVGFVGTKGFAGGFGKQMVQPFGEAALKTFIRTSIDEVVQLENALAKLQCKYRVAVLHYAPIRDTLIGEHPEIFPFLGSSRLANAIDRQGVDVIFHGHAHNGSPKGHTQGNIPVYNVSRFVLKQNGSRPYCIVTLPDDA